MVQIRKMRNAVRAEEPSRRGIWDIKFTSSSLQLSNEGDFILPHGAQFLRLWVDGMTSITIDFRLQKSPAKQQCSLSFSST